MEGIASVLFNDQSGVLDLSNSIAISRADRAHSLGVSGAGVNVAVFESGPRNPAADIPIRDRFLANPNISDESHEHGHLVCAIINNTETAQPHGFAPGCNLFSANSFDIGALVWAAKSRGCTVINQSFHRIDEQTSADMSVDDLMKDDIGSVATIVQAAGNFGPWDTPPSTDKEYVNHKGYNTIVVGNHDDNATAMSNDSVFRNPSQTGSLDRELPHIAANGVNITAVGENNSGTSFAAPAVAGTVALIQQSNPNLMREPTVCRAILLASADRNISGSTWWQDVQIPTDASDGAGALNAEAALLIVQRRATKDGPPRKCAWDGGSWFFNIGQNFGPDKISKFRYYVQVPPATTTGRFTVKVAFTWGSMVPYGANGPVLPHMSFLDRNYDLIVFDDRGVQVANSSSFDNNYEIAEFASLPNQEYAIALRLTRGNDLPRSAGIAWIVTET
jgi:hypothetical protein